MPLARPLVAGALFVLAVSLSATPRAQTDRFPGLWLTDLRVEGMAVLGDTVFVGGRFRQVGPPTGQLAVLDKATGEADSDLPRVNAYALTAFSSGTLAILPDGRGGYFAGGNITALDGSTPHHHLIHVRSDGTVDPAFRLNPTLRSAIVGAAVSTLALDRSAPSPSGAGVLYVGGQFDAIAGQPRQALAALDAETGAVLPFNANLALQITFPDNPRDASTGMLIARGGILYVGGDFSHIAGQPRPNAVALDGATGALLPWAAAPNAPAFPVAEGDGTLYLTGFSSINGQSRPRLAEVTLYDPATGGGAVTAWTPQEPVFGFDFVVGGRYLWVTDANGAALRRIDRVSGAVTFVSPPGISSGRSVAFDPTGGPSGQGVLYVGGQGVDPSGNNPFPVVVAVDALTAQPTGYRVRGATEGNYVGSLAVEPGPGGRLFVGGTFITFGAGVVPRQGLAAFDLTTGLPTDFAAGVTGPGQGLFEDIALSPDGRFLYGYSNVVGGASLRLTEFELATGARREFIPQGLTAATYGAHVAEVRADGQNAGARTARGEHAASVLNPRVENATSALVVTDTRLCLSLNGVACYDRATAARLFYTPMVYVGTISENNGDLAYLPTGGPGGAAGTLYLAAPVEEAPVGTSRPALVAVGFETGVVLGQWTPGFNFVGAEGYALALFDRDGAGPAQTALYAGGDRDWTVRGVDHEPLATFDLQTAALGPWAPRVAPPVFALAAHNTPGVSGGVGGVVYAGGVIRFIDGVLRPAAAAAFDAVTGAHLSAWALPFGVTFVLLASEQHDTVFLGGNFGDMPRGSGHAGLTGVSPAAPILPTAGEGGGPAAPSGAASLTVAGPNPFRSQTALALTLPDAGPVEASLFDVLGRRVAVLHEGTLAAGTHTLAIDASALPAGVYVAHVTASGFAEALTLTVVR